MKDSKEKEHRISNLKDMIDNINEHEVVEEEIEEDLELINYLNEDKENYDEDFEIDDEFIYRPDDNDYAINLEENPINEDFLIKAPKEDSENEDTAENDELFDDFTTEMSENFDNIVNAKIGRTPILGIASTIIGLIFIVLAAIIFSSRSDRIIDNVVSGETNFISVIFLILGLLLLIYGLYKVIGFKNPLEGLSNSIDSVEINESRTKKEEPEDIIPKSNILLDKESYKIGEFNIKELRNKLKKPSKPKKPAPPTQEELDKIPPAREKPKEKKGLTADEIEEMEYEQVVREHESIDDIFAEVEDIDEIPIISVDSEDKIKK